MTTEKETTRYAQALLPESLFLDYKTLCAKEKTNASADLRGFITERVEKAKKEGIIK
jgi:hypothetical protein